MATAVVRAPDAGSGRSRALVSLWLALLGVAAAGAVAFRVADGLLRPPDATSVLQAVAVILYVYVGTYTSWRRPGARLGFYLTGIGLLFAGASLSSSHHEVVHTIGRATFAVFSVCVAFVFLVFPHDRLSSHVERVVIAAFAGATVAVWAVTLPLAPKLPAAGPLTDCGSSCPGNAFQVAQVSHSAGSTLADIANLISASGAFAVAFLLVLKLRSPTELRRRLLGPLLICACVQVVNFGLYVIARQLGVGPTGGLKILGIAAALAVPVAMLVGQARGRVFAATSLAHLVVRASGQRLTPELVQDMLRGALGDPLLRLALWETSRNVYLDVDGRPVELPPHGDEVTVTLVEREGKKAAALIHDASLVEGADIAEGLAATSLLLLDHTALIEELQASRGRIVASAQHERLRLERNLHDGAQQRLFAIQIKLDAIRDRVRGDELAGAVDEISTDAAAAVDELRTLAQGLYPTVLRERGLVDALRSRAQVSETPVRVIDKGVGRCSDTVEEAIYFCALEAIQNASKHAGRGARVTVTLGRSGDALDVTIADNGAGFDVAQHRQGVGLVSMHDRIGAVGGVLDIKSSPRGTIIEAHVARCGG